MLKKREVLAVAPTGSGKTAAFLVPLLTLLQARARGGPCAGRSPPPRRTTPRRGARACARWCCRRPRSWRTRPTACCCVSRRHVCGWLLASLRRRLGDLRVCLPQGRKWKIQLLTKGNQHSVEGSTPTALAKCAPAPLAPVRRRTDSRDRAGATFWSPRPCVSSTPCTLVRTHSMPHGGRGGV
jgi:hypothetical protein